MKGKRGRAPHSSGPSVSDGIAPWPALLLLLLLLLGPSHLPPLSLREAHDAVAHRASVGSSGVISANALLFDLLDLDSICSEPASLPLVCQLVCTTAETACLLDTQCGSALTDPLSEVVGASVGLLQDYFLTCCEACDPSPSSRFTQLQTILDLTCGDECTSVVNECVYSDDCFFTITNLFPRDSNVQNLIAGLAPADASLVEQLVACAYACNECSRVSACVPADPVCDFSSMATCEANNCVWTGAGDPVDECIASAECLALPANATCTAMAGCSLATACETCDACNPIQIAPSTTYILSNISTFNTGLDYPQLSPSQLATGVASVEIDASNRVLMSISGGAPISAYSVHFINATSISAFDAIVSVGYVLTDDMGSFSGPVIPSRHLPTLQTQLVADAAVLQSGLSGYFLVYDLGVYRNEAGTCFYSTTASNVAIPALCMDGDDGMLIHPEPLPIVSPAAFHSCDFSSGICELVYPVNTSLPCSTIADGREFDCVYRDGCSLGTCAPVEDPCAQFDLETCSFHIVGEAGIEPSSSGSSFVNGSVSADVLLGSLGTLRACEVVGSRCVAPSHRCYSHTQQECASDAACLFTNSSEALLQGGLFSADALTCTETLALPSLSAIVDAAECVVAEALATVQVQNATWGCGLDPVVLTATFPSEVEADGASVFCAFHLVDPLQSLAYNCSWHGCRQPAVLATREQVQCTPPEELFDQALSPTTLLYVTVHIFDAMGSDITPKQNCLPTTGLFSTPISCLSTPCTTSLRSVDTNVLQLCENNFTTSSEAIVAFSIPSPNTNAIYRCLFWPNAATGGGTAVYSAPLGAQCTEETPYGALNCSSNVAFPNLSSGGGSKRLVARSVVPSSHVFRRAGDAVATCVIPEAFASSALTLVNLVEIQVGSCRIPPLFSLVDQPQADMGFLFNASVCSSCPFATEAARGVGELLHSPSSPIVDDAVCDCIATASEGAPFTSCCGAIGAFCNSDVNDLSCQCSAVDSLGCPNSPCYVVNPNSTFAPICDVGMGSVTMFFNQIAFATTSGELDGILAAFETALYSLVSEATVACMHTHHSGTTERFTITVYFLNEDAASEVDTTLEDDGFAFSDGNGRQYVASSRLQEDDGGQPLSLPVVVGGAVGGLVLIVLIVGVLGFGKRKHETMSSRAGEVVDGAAETAIGYRDRSQSQRSFSSIYSVEDRIAVDGSVLVPKATDGIHVKDNWDYPSTPDWMAINGELPIKRHRDVTQLVGKPQDMPSSTSSLSSSNTPASDEAVIIETQFVTDSAVSSFPRKASRSSEAMIAALSSDVAASKMSRKEIADAIGTSLLHLAAAEGNVGAFLQFATSREAPGHTPSLPANTDAIDQSTVNSVDVLGRTPLMFAVMFGHRDVVETILSKGGSARVADRQSRTAFHHACLSTAPDAVDIATILVSAPNSGGGEVGAWDDSGFTGLHYASARSCLDLLAALAKAGVDLSYPDATGLTIGHQAVMYENEGLLKLYLDHIHGYPDRLHQRDLGGYSMLHWCARLDWVQGARMLLEQNCDPLLGPKLPLHLCIQEGSTQVLHMLLTLPDRVVIAQLAIRPPSNDKVIEFALARNNEEVIAMLVQVAKKLGVRLELSEHDFSSLVADYEFVPTAVSEMDPDLDPLKLVHFTLYDDGMPDNMTSFSVDSSDRSSHSEAGHTTSPSSSDYPSLHDLAIPHAPMVPPLLSEQGYGSSRDIHVSRTASANHSALGSRQGSGDVLKGKKSSKKKRRRKKNWSEEAREKNRLDCKRRREQLKKETDGLTQHVRALEEESDELRAILSQLLKEKRGLENAIGS